MRFKGKIAKWFYSIMIIVAVILIPVIVLAVIDGEAFVLAVVLSIFVFIEAFFISIIFRNFVELKSDSLLIVFGVVRVSILYNDMKEIRTTRDFSSSLAASFDRIRIQYKNGKTVMISLQNKQQFYKEIQKKKSDLIII